MALSEFVVPLQNLLCLNIDLKLNYKNYNQKEFLYAGRKEFRMAVSRVEVQIRLFASLHTLKTQTCLRMCV